MKNLLFLAFLILLFGCATGGSGRGCLSTTNNWYREGRTSRDTATELMDCVKRAGTICNGTVLEDCMIQKGYTWYLTGENPRLKKPE